MKHTIKLKDLLSHSQDSKILFASSSRERKQLFIVMSGGYQVKCKGEIVLETMTPKEAVDKYNEI